MDVTQRAQRGPEVRSYTVSGLEMRDGSKGGFDFHGVASVVDTPYGVRDQFGEFEETILKGAFNRTIQQRSDVRLLKNHDPSNVFARTKSGTMSLRADPHLSVTALDLDPTNPAVQVLRSELKRGDIDQMSMGFNVKDDEWNADYSERQIKEIALAEVSIVAFPASPTTSAGIRSFRSIFEEQVGNDLTESEIRRAIAELEAQLGRIVPDTISETERLLRWNRGRRS